MVVDVCRGLHFAHRMGVVHRDVKPANIRITHDGTVKILDFGIARLRGTDSTDPNLTQAGMVLGTPSYLSPELVQGAKVDHRADMWAVGVILYEIVAGRRPFEAPTITSLITRIVNSPPPPLDASLHLPEGLAAVDAASARQGPGAPLRGPPRDGEGAAERDRRDTAAGAAARPARQEARLRGELRRGAPHARRGRPVGRARGCAAREVARPLPHRHRLADQGHRAAPALGYDAATASQGSGARDGLGRDPHGDRHAAPHAGARAGATGHGQLARAAGPARAPRHRDLARARCFAPSASSGRSASRPPPRKRRFRPSRTCSPSPEPTVPSGSGTCARATVPGCCARTCTGARGTTPRRWRSPSRRTGRCSPPPTWTVSCTCGTCRRATRCRSSSATTSRWGRSPSRPTARRSPPARSTRTCVSSTWGRRSRARPGASCCASPRA